MKRRTMTLILVFLAIPFFGQTGSSSSPATSPAPTSGPSASPSPKPSSAPRTSIPANIDLSLTTGDLRIEQVLDGGYYLYIRKKPGIQSVLLTESTRDPNMKLDSYALRNPKYHAENGDEKRIILGKVITDKDLYGRYSLIDSTPMADPVFGQAFRIFIPYVVIFGNPESRYGELQVLDGTYLSIRAFAFPYGEYTSSDSYRDNPFTISVTQAPLEGPPEGNYMADTVKAFKELADASKGKVSYSKGEADLLRSLDELLKSLPNETMDLILCLDATQSMENDAPFLRDKLVPLLKQNAVRFPKIRFGVVQYRDYLEEFLYKITPFQEDFSVVQNAIDRYRPAGGRDIPEAVYEALYAGLSEFSWQSKQRLIVLVGDAPPHPIPRGTVSFDMVERKSAELGVIINPIILPQ